MMCKLLRKFFQTEADCEPRTSCGRTSDELRSPRRRNHQRTESPTVEKVRL